LNTIIDCNDNRWLLTHTGGKRWLTLNKSWIRVGEKWAVDVWLRETPTWQQTHTRFPSDCKGAESINNCFRIAYRWRLREVAVVVALLVGRNLMPVHNLTV
jgi:hypothetical protein